MRSEPTDLHLIYTVHSPQQPTYLRRNIGYRSGVQALLLLYNAFLCNILCYALNICCLAHDMMKIPVRNTACRTMPYSWPCPSQSVLRNQSRTCDSYRSESSVQSGWSFMWMVSWQGVAIPQLWWFVTIFYDHYHMCGNGWDRPQRSVHSLTSEG